MLKKKIVFTGGTGRFGIIFKKKYNKKKFTHLLKSLLNTCAPWKTSFIFVTFATFCELDKSVENTLVNEK